MSNPTQAPTPLKRPTIIGLVGGVASGKSSVAGEMQKLGALVIDADKVGHEVLDEQEIRARLTAKFGQTILSPDGRIDRRLLSARVFGNPAMLQALGEITHPRIRSEIRCRLDEAKAKASLPAVVLDVSLLLESGAYAQDLDAVVFVNAPNQQREERANRDRGWDLGEVGRREAHQKSLDEKRGVSAYEILNDGSRERLAERVKELFAKLTGVPSST